MKCARNGFIALMFFFLTAAAASADDGSIGKIGVGFEGMKYGNLITGVSTRSWILNRFGFEGNVFYGKVKCSYSEETITGDLWEVEPKVMVAIFVNQNSRFYAGAKLGYGRFGFEASDLSKHKGVFNPGVLIGTEFSFSELPELGFNFEFGYSRNLYKIEGIKITIDGTSVAGGIHYYF